MTTVAIDSQARTLVTGDDKGRALIWTKGDRYEIEHTLQHEPPSPVVAAALNPEARRVATGTGDGKIAVWDAKSGKLLSQWNGHDASGNFRSA